MEENEINETKFEGGNTKNVKNPLYGHQDTAQAHIFKLYVFIT